MLITKELPPIIWWINLNTMLLPTPILAQREAFCVLLALGTKIPEHVIVISSKNTAHLLVKHVLFKSFAPQKQTEEGKWTAVNMLMQ